MSLTRTIDPLLFVNNNCKSLATVTHFSILVDENPIDKDSSEEKSLPPRTQSNSIKKGDLISSLDEEAELLVLLNIN